MSGRLWLQIDDEDVGNMSLQFIYDRLHQASRVKLTVIDRPCIITLTLHGAEEVQQFEACLEDMEDGRTVGADPSRYGFSCSALVKL
jgi:hypothetical protein